MLQRLPSLLILLILPVLAGAAPAVSVSIKPIHSLVSAVMDGIAEPDLIISGDDDPHITSLVPSQRRLLARSDLIVWVGGELEASLVKAISRSTADGKSTSLSLLETGLPHRFPARNSHGDEGSTDPHIWLSPRNAMHIVRVVSETLGRLDNTNAERYRDNRDRTIRRIEDLATRIESELSVPGTAYIAHHDAYQYFERSFGLEAAGFIRDHEDAPVSAAQLGKLKHMVESRKANCIVYDTEPRPDIIASLGSTELTRIVRAPVIGAGFDAGRHQWFDLVRKTGHRFRQCLQ